MIIDQMERALEDDLAFGAFQTCGMVRVVVHFDVGARDGLMAGVACH